MSQKHCSLALDEVKTEEQGHLNREPDFDLLVSKAYLANNDSFLHILAAQEEAVKVRGKIIVSF